MVCEIRAHLWDLLRVAVLRGTFAGSGHRNWRTRQLALEKRRVRFGNRIGALSLDAYASR
jgi:hypothetical protein